MHEDPKKPVKEQNPIAWLLGFKESEEQKKARSAREAATKESVTKAIKGYGTLKKVVKDNEDPYKKHVKKYFNHDPTEVRPGVKIPKDK